MIDGNDFWELIGETIDIADDFIPIDTTSYTSDVPADGITLRATKKTNRTERWRCGHCRTMNVPELDVCKNCSSSFDQREKTTVELARERIKNNQETGEF